MLGRKLSVLLICAADALGSLQSADICGAIAVGACEPNDQCQNTKGCEVLGSRSSDDLHECCEMCRNTSGCQAWTLNTKKTPGTCWLRSMPTPQQSKGFCTTGHIPATPKGAKNVLLFAIDDLRTELGIYGATHIKSPNIDALAQESMVFERMYTAVAVCAPARQAMLTGRRPDTTGNWRIDGAEEYWRKKLPQASSLPQYFKESGYVVYGVGKVFHEGAGSGDNDKNYSWSPEGLPYYAGTERAADSDIVGEHPKGWAIYNVSDEQLQDGDIAERAVEIFEEMQHRKEARPFFLAVGFHKPHMPQNCPLKYYEMYPLEEVALAKNPTPPKGLPSIAAQTSKQHRNWLELDTTTGACVENFTVWGTEQCRYPDDVARQARRSYYACTSYTDANVGRVLGALQAAGYGNDTIVVLWGDHGWHLGEHQMWAKYTNFEHATRTPFVMRLAGQSQPLRTSALVEANDIFPSLADAAGLPVPPLCTPSSQDKVCVEGVSMLPLWDAPARRWKQTAFMQYPRPYSGFPTAQVDIDAPEPFAKNNNQEAVMGYAMREDRWRYVEWVKFNHTTALPDWSVVFGQELYSHEANPVVDGTFDYENENLASDPAHADLVEAMRARLKDGWRHALPESYSFAPDLPEIPAFAV